MEFDIFDTFADDARVWVYAFQKDLDESSLEVVHSALADFCNHWQSHGEPVTGRYLIYKHRFAIISGITAEGLSGFSIDSSVQVFKKLHIEHNLSALDAVLVHYLEGGAVQSVTRAAFAERCKRGEVSPDTIVYNCSIQTVGELRAGKFECPFNESWHASAFELTC